jgi:nucleotide-binding universal stress UspA family protein
VATGESMGSDAAVVYAVALTVHLGSELRILAVLTIPAAVATPEVMSSPDFVLESTEREGKELLAQAAAAGVRYGAQLAKDAPATRGRWGRGVSDPYTSSNR